MNILCNPTGRAPKSGRQKASLTRVLVAAVLVSSPLSALENEAIPTLQQYCFTCHGDAAAAGGLSLETLSKQEAVADSFKQWEKVAEALEAHKMPPAPMPQPTDAQRAQVVSWIRAELDAYTKKHAGDPGVVTVRQLTSAEYAYTVQDLTGLDLDIARHFQGEAVGGEGFSNFGSVQFMADAKLELYLEAAKTIADHAVIGAGPLSFFADPGLSGFELSAVDRIQKIYFANGFRAASGEGGRPYGMDRYSQAFFVAWQYKNRKALGLGDATISDLAAKEGVSPRFVDHIWSVMHASNPTYPTAKIVDLWQNLPVPGASSNKDEVLAAARAGSMKVQEEMIFWPRWLLGAGELAAGGAGDERALVLTAAELQASKTNRFRFQSRLGRNDKPSVMISVTSANPGSLDQPPVVWSGGVVRFQSPERPPTPGAQQPESQSEAQPAQQQRGGGSPGLPLRELLGPELAAKIGFGKGLNGEIIDEDSFVTQGETELRFELDVPSGSRGFTLQLDAAVQFAPDSDAVLRATISNGAMSGRPDSALLADPKGAGYKAWTEAVLDFGVVLPQISHREPTPSDRDPIPPPYNNDYNQPERDEFHYTIKYTRDDSFLVEKMLDDESRIQLEQAWADLKTSFEYHDAFLRFTARKLDFDLGDRRIADLDPAWIAKLPAEPRKYVEQLKTDFDFAMAAEKRAEPGHVDDAIEFASRAWRRPLTTKEEADLRAFYRGLREGSQLDHRKAIQALLTRILVAPAFIYRIENPSEQAGISPLSEWDIASRLSYFLWSSLPDSELRRAAAAGELSDEANLRKQVKRMLADPKARRLSTEFFGQWLGFYRFDQYRGVDTGRFPEFTDEVKSAMYDEAVSFFEYVVRNDRPIREILSADYAFLNKTLAEFYGGDKEAVTSDGPAELVKDANGFQRGGLVRLGAILTATSAPLRTSPVKRGDWLLRRVVGTPVPPPPANIPPIPTDDKAFTGTIREQLAAHQANPTCANCHSRIDPLGFPLEHYDAIGRWRDTYSEGQAIEDSGTLSDNTEIAGIDGLVDYLEANESQVVQTVAEKLVGYALGRTVLASDRPLIDALSNAGGDATFADLIAEIATSRQFRYLRNDEANQVAEAATAGASSRALDRKGEE